MKNRVFFIVGLLLVLGLTFSCKTVKRDKKAPETKELSNIERYEVTALFIEANKEKIIGNFGNARALYAEVIRRDPANDAAYYELASILAMDKNYDDAIILAKEALRLDKKNDWYYLLLAELYQNTQNHKQAYKTLESLIKLNPDNIAYYYELATAYLYAQRFKDAVKAYDNIEGFIGVTEEISIQKQSIYMYIKKPKLAVVEIEKLIKTFPQNYNYLLYLADIHIELKQMNRAHELFLEVVKNDPENTQVHLSLADYYRNIKAYDKSYEYLKKAFLNANLEIETKVNILLSYFQVTESGFNKDLKEQAYELLDILIEVHPQEAISYSIYADFLNRDKNHEKSRKMFIEVLGFDKSKYIIWEQLLKIELELRNYKELDSLSDLALELFPEQSLLYLFNGYANFNLKNYDKAAKAFKNGIIYTLFNDDLRMEFYIYLAESYNHLKNYPESDAAFDNALKIEPDNVYVLNNYSYYLAMRGEKLEKAEKMAKKSNTLRPDNASYQDTYAWVLYKMEDYANALIWLEKALSNNGSKNGVILEHYGDVLYRLDRKEEALKYWEKAKEAERGSELLDEKINTKTLTE